MNIQHAKARVLEGILEAVAVVPLVAVVAAEAQPIEVLA
jgi:hypothetical protein